MVEITRCPTSAAVRAARAVSASTSSPDEDDVGVLAQPAAERGRVPDRVGADLALGDDGLDVGVQHLDRVLDGEDVARRGGG